MQPSANEHWTIEAIERQIVAWPWMPCIVFVAPMAVVRFFLQFCVQWGAALAYYSLIGLVPLLTALFALMKLAGYHRGVTPYVVSTIGAGSPQIARQIVEFIDQTNMRAVGVVSALGAVLAAIVITGNAELCFNRIWGLPGRTLRHKARSFFKVMVVAPLLLLLALALTAVMQPGGWLRDLLDAWYLGHLVYLVLRVLPYALLWLGFTLLYTGLPNTDVRLRSALVGAVVAGTLWQIAQLIYVSYVIRMVRYSAVYGALWQVPILLAWLYLAWCIILFGAQVTRAHQQAVAIRARGREPVAPLPQSAPVSTEALPLSDRPTDAQ
jgi:membrane protein